MQYHNSPADNLSVVSEGETYKSQDESVNQSMTKKVVITPNIIEKSTCKIDAAKDEFDAPKQKGCVEESKIEQPRQIIVSKGMSQTEYNDWCRLIKQRVQPWIIIKEAGSNEVDSWGEVSIRANGFGGSNPEQQSPSIK